MEDTSSRKRRRSGSAAEPGDSAAGPESAQPTSHIFYCSLLELLAFVLHPGDTQSTSTICLSIPQSTLYLTSQSNFDFGQPQPEEIQRKLDLIRAALIGNLRPGDQKGVLQDKKNKTWVEQHAKESESALTLLTYCACVKPRRLYRTDIAANSGYAKLRSTFEEVFVKVFNRCKQEFNQSIFDTVRAAIRTVTIVTNDDLFPWSSGYATSGLHGESRIVRYIFIKQFSPLLLEKQQFSAKVGGIDPKVLENVPNKVIKKFKKYLAEKSLWMGSSQGTCLRCKGLTDAYCIQTGPPGNSPLNEWMHPIHFMPFNGSRYRFNAENLRHHAFKGFFLVNEAGWAVMKVQLEAFLEPGSGKRSKVDQTEKEK